MKQYETITTLSDQDLKDAYKELLLDKLPTGAQSIIRVLQIEVSREQGKTIPLSTIQYKVAMEFINRFMEVE